MTFWREADATARRALIAASLGWMLDAFDVMLYALVLSSVRADLNLSAEIAGDYAENLRTGRPAVEYFEVDGAAGVRTKSGTAIRMASTHPGGAFSHRESFHAITVVWTVRIFTVIAVLARFGVQTASLIAVLGAAGLAVGLALQGTLQNIAAGIMLLILRPIRAGEYIALSSGADGTVEEVGLFLTRLVQGDGIHLTLPNSTVWNATITNYSRNKTRRLDIPVPVRYGDDLDAVTNSAAASPPVIRP